mgnify:CR=1 FL=1|jgi:hypothetical protein
MRSDRFSALILNHPFLVLLASSVLLAGAVAGLPRTQLVSDFEIFFEADNPDLIAYHEQQDAFTTDNNIMFVLTPADGDVFTPDTMAVVEELTEAAWTLPDSVRVDSLSNYQHTSADGDDLLVEPLVENAGQMGEAELDRAREIAINEVTLYKRLIRDGDVTGVNVTFFLDTENKNTEIPKIVAATRAMAEDFRARYPTMDIRLVGKLINNTAFRESSLHDLTHLVPIAFLLAMACIGGYMWLGSRRAVTVVTGTFSVLVVIAFSILTAHGIAAWLGFPVTPPVANAPTMILTLAIADSIHILVGYFQAQRQGQDKKAAMASSLDLNFQPVFLTSATTIVGFLSLNFSDSPPFQDLGNIVAIGVALAWLYSVILLPALMMLLPSGVAPRVQDGSYGDPRLRKLAEVVISRYRPILVTGLSLVVLAALFIPRNELNDVWSEYFDESTVQRQSSDYAREHLTSPNSISFTLSAGEQGSVTDPQYLATVDAFAEWLRGHEFVYHVFSFSDVMKRINKNMHGDDPDWYRLPQDRDLAAQYLLMYEFSLPFGLDVNNQLNMGKTASKLIVTARNSSTGDMLALQDDAQQWLRDNAPPAMFHTGASGDVMFAHIGQRNIRSMLFGTILALVGISFLIALMLRSVRYGLISLLPNLAPAAVAFGLWGAFNGQIGLSLSVVVGMTLGIVVDYTVHFLSKYLRAKRDNGLDTADAVRYAFNTVGVALVVTTVILCVNFGVLAMSTFKLNSDMGLMTALTIFIALLVDFFLLAPLMMWLESQKKGGPRNGARQPVTQQDSTAHA